MEKKDCGDETAAMKWPSRAAVYLLVSLFLDFIHF
jgi:hypothetical protein